LARFVDYFNATAVAAPLSCESVNASLIMLKLLKRWLGWDSETGVFDFSDLTPPARRPASPPDVTPGRAAEPAPHAKTSPSKGSTAAPSKPKKSRTPMDVLDNPRLTLDRPKDDGFDPYNTGAFNRSASWEKIGRQKKR
jgi:hypothetical protein